MAQKRLKVVYRLEYDYGYSGDPIYAWEIHHGNELILGGARTYSTKSNLFRGIRRAMEKLGITASGSMPLFPVYYDIVEGK